MATVVNLLYATGRETVEGRYYERHYQVFDTSADPNIILQKQAAGLPGYGDWYPTDGYSQVTRLRCPSPPAEINDGGTRKYKWEVVVDYEPRTSNVARAADPTSENPRVSISTLPREEVFETDLDGSAVVNSARDPFDPPALEIEHDDLLSVTVNIAAGSLNVAATLAYKDSCNNAQVTVCDYVIPQYAGLMRDIRVEAQSRNGTDYYAVTYEIQVTRRAGLWRYRKLLDQGYKYLDAADSNRKKAILDEEGNRVSQPALLDGSGGQLAAGGTPQYLDYKAKSPLDWSSLSLPASTF